MSRDTESILETDGSSTKELHFIADSQMFIQCNAYNKKKWNLMNFIRVWFTYTFLPEGFPFSVSEDYLSYQIWDTLQAFCSTITGILATQEVLRGVGVGDHTATPLAATLTWVLRDGCGHIGRILFAIKCGKHMDANSKRWRLYADIINNIAMCLELTLSTVKSLTIIVLCCSTVLRGIVGVAGGATRIAMTHHHAKFCNFADISAKDSAQETAVNLIASVIALLILSVSMNAVSLNLVFLVFVILHLIFNYKVCKVTCIRQFNETRLLVFLDLFETKKIFSTPEKINAIEPILYNSQYTDQKLCAFKIVLGCSLSNIIEKNNTPFITRLLEIYREKVYVTIPDMDKRCVFVLFKERAVGFDIIEGYMHAYLLSLKLKNYLKDVGFKGKSSKRVNCLYIENHIVNWRSVLTGLKAGMIAKGWDISNHQLIVDYWRISHDDFN